MNSPFITNKVLFIVFIFTFEFYLTGNRDFTVRFRYNNAQRKWSILNRIRPIRLISSDHTFLWDESMD